MASFAKTRSPGVGEDILVAVTVIRCQTVGRASSICRFSSEDARTECLCGRVNLSGSIFFFAVGGFLSWGFSVSAVPLIQAFLSRKTSPTIKE